MKEIPLTQGYVTIVDDDTYEWASQLKWCVSTGGGRKSVYALHNSDKRRIKISLSTSYYCE